jgi:starch phosphorylase
VLDPNALTLGFARRFTDYKRPTLLLRDRDRLVRLLSDPRRPTQMVVAGKAHPEDEVGRRMVTEWALLARDPRVRQQLVFIEDYDLTVAQELVGGVDLWLNTPRRPFEACGTSGMKVLANGGLNLSTLDGWWDEAYAPELGWALGDPGGATASEGDDADGRAVYRILEEEAIPEFYDRDAAGVPRAWVARIRASMAALAPRFSANRMVREYVEAIYLPAVERLRRRAAEGSRVARELFAWETRLARGWHEIHFGNVAAHREGDVWAFAVPVYLGDLRSGDVGVELYADADGERPAVRQPLDPAEPIQAAVNGAVYRGRVPADRPDSAYTARAVPGHPDARVPTESGRILWQR